MSRVIRVRYEKGVLKPLEPIDLHEGEEVRVIIKTSVDSIAKRFYGVVKKHRPKFTREEFYKVIEEIENEDIRGF